MIATIELTAEELRDLRESTGEFDVGVALRLAVREYARYVKRMRLLDLAGNVEMDDSWLLGEQEELKEQARKDAAGLD